MVEHIEALSGTGGVPIHQVKHSTTTSSLAHIGELFSVMQSLGELFSDCSPDLNPHRSGREDSHLITNLSLCTLRPARTRLVHLSILTPLSLIWRGLRVPDVSRVVLKNRDMFC